MMNKIAKLLDRQLPITAVFHNMIKIFISGVYLLHNTRSLHPTSVYLCDWHVSVNLNIYFNI